MIETLTMAKWINRGTNKFGTFGEEKGANKSTESNQNLRIFAERKNVLPISNFVDQGIPQRAKY